VRVKCWVSGLAPFLAVIVNLYVPAVFAAGVPESAAVPFPLSVNVTLDGSLPVSDKLGMGTPVDVTVKAQRLPTVHVVWSALVIWGLWRTMRVKVWLAPGLTPFVAMILSRYTPPVPRAGVPASVAAPPPLSVNLTPFGRLRGSDNVELGHPVVVTVKVPAWPTVKVVPAELVIPGAWLTVRVKVWVASGLTPFVAVIVNGYVPPVSTAGVPESVAVPPPLSVNVTPDGRVAPPSDNVALGTPVAVTVKVPAWPTVKVVPAGLVIPGDWRTERVKVWVALEPTPFMAVIVTVYSPPESAAGVPEIVPVPSPLSVSVTPGGRPVADNAHVGSPVDLTVKVVPACPTVKVAWSALPIAHACPGTTVRGKVWVASVPTPLWAVIVTEDGPGVVGVPENVPVPFPLSVNETPSGRPVADNAHVGHPVDVTVDGTVEGQGNPAVRVVVSGAPVIRHAWSTVRVKLWVA